MKIVSGEFVLNIIKDNKNYKKISFAVIATCFFLLNFTLEKTPSVYLIGDSTMSDKPLVDNPERGWGMALPYFFSNEVKFENHAKNGRSTRSFISQGRWQNVLDKLQPGDYVFIQFGHNDEKGKDPDRYTPALTVYKANLIKFVKETREKGATPVLLTPIMRRRFRDGEFYDTHGDYPLAVRQAAEEYDVPLIDHHAKSKELIVEFGEEKSKELFLWIKPGEYDSLPGGKSDDTHFSIKGAYLMASLAVEGMKEIDLPLLRWYKDNGGLGYLNGRNLFSIVNDDFDKGEEVIFEVEIPQFPRRDFNILKYGAVGDGFTLNTKAMNDAITACSEAGGGRVVIPKGLWLTGPIWMKDNVNLYTEKGSLVQFSTDKDLYPLIDSDWEGTKQWRCESPINGRKLKNIAITGSGIFDGGGDVWRQVKKEKLTFFQWEKIVESGGIVDEIGTTWYPSKEAMAGYKIIKKFQDPSFRMPKEEAEKIRDYFRPVLLSLIGCKNVMLDGPTFQNSPAWNLHILECEGVVVRNVNVRNPWYSQNGDGIDIEACNRTILLNSSFDVGDDAVCIKSGRNEHGRDRGLPTQNLLVKDIVVYHAHGGFTIGSEMSGGAKNIRVTNCNYIGTDVGLRFKSNRERGGIVENIYIDNIFMKDIPTRAISFNMFYGGMSPADAFNGSKNKSDAEPAPITDGTPTFRNIHMDNIYCNGAEDAFIMQGLPERAIEKVYLSNSVLKSQRSVMILDANQIKLSNVKLQANETPLFMVSQSTNLFLEKIETGEISEFMKVSGDKCSDIVISNSPEVSSEKIEYQSGASSKSVGINKESVK